MTPEDIKNLLNGNSQATVFFFLSSCFLPILPPKQQYKQEVTGAFGASQFPKPAIVRIERRSP